MSYSSSEAQCDKCAPVSDTLIGHLIELGFDFPHWSHDQQNMHDWVTIDSIYSKE